MKDAARYLMPTSAPSTPSAATTSPAAARPMATGRNRTASSIKLLGVVPTLRACQARARAGRPRPRRAEPWRNWSRATASAAPSDAEKPTASNCRWTSLSAWSATSSLKLGRPASSCSASKRTPYTIDYLADLARRIGHRLQVRLARVARTDAEPNVRRSLACPATRYSPASRTPTCRTWPAPSVCLATASCCTRCSPPTTRRRLRQSSRSRKAALYEHQKLHGMGDDLVCRSGARRPPNVPCRVYAPVGSHEDRCRIWCAASRKRR